MSDKKHIDRLFQEKFKDFEVTPNSKVWDNIEAKLHPEKKRRVIPFWWTFGGVAAALLLLFAVGNFVLNTNSSTNPNVVKSDTTETNKDTSNNSSVVKSSEATNAIDKGFSSEKNQNSKTETISNYKSTSQEASVVYNKNNTKTSFSNSSDLASQEDNNNSKDNNTSYSKTNIVAHQTQNKSLNKNTFDVKSDEDIKGILESKTATEVIAKSDVNNTSETSVSEIQKNEDTGQDIEEAIAEANQINEKEKQLRRWSIAPNVAPVYFNSLGQGSAIDAQFVNNNTANDISMSYGVKGSYAINERLKVTGGINRVSFNSTTNDVIAMSDNSFSSLASTAGRLENINLDGRLSHESLTLVSRPSLSQSSISESINTIQTGSLEQRFGFIEIPLELEYRLIDKKIGINLSSGFSTLFLNENDILVDLNGQNTSIGEANNINDTSFSANFGIGVDYNITEKLNINLEPKFKYQLNTFTNTSGDFRPFFIGVYTGLNFKF